MNPEQAYRHSSKHRDEVLNSKACGCFHCLSIFTPDLIDHWTDLLDGIGQTAFCPSCGIDSVIGDRDVPFTKPLLEEMRATWFGVPIPSSTEKVWAAIRNVGMPRVVDVDFRSLELEDEGKIARIAIDLRFKRESEVCCGEPGCYVPFLGVRSELVPEAIRAALALPESPRVELSATLLHESGFKYKSIGSPVDQTIEYVFDKPPSRS